MYNVLVLLIYLFVHFYLCFYIYTSKSEKKVICVCNIHFTQFTYNTISLSLLLRQNIKEFLFRQNIKLLWLNSQIRFFLKTTSSDL